MMAKKYRTSYVISRKIEIKWLVYTSLFILFLVLQSWILYQRPPIANLPGIFAEAEPKSDLGENLIEDASKAQDKIEQKCADCRLTSNSIEELIRKPRQMNSYGQVDDRIDLEKIKKAVCKELIIDSERESCRSFYFNHLSTIQKWKQAYSRMSFFDFVCIKELKYCCPRNSFGPKCIKCQQCGPNQHCHGDGSRTGNGECVCNEGYTGADCASCNQGYFLDKNSDFYLNDSSFKATCKPCHRSCLYCRQVGPLGCEVCRSGFSWIPGYGCSDIDECIRNKKICGENTFCVNTEGSYFCYECDRACDGCHGDGPDMCLRCAKGHHLVKGNCVAEKITIMSPEANYYRYAIYLGLCLCTCIIFSHNIFVASVIGLGVAVYISCSEYVMLNHVLDKERGI